MNIRKFITREKTQKKVATDLGISEQTFSNYISEKTQPDFTTLIKIADYFHTTTDALLEHEVPYLLDKSILSAPCQRVINKICKLSERQCELLEVYIIGMLAADQEKQNTISKFKGE